MSEIFIDWGDSTQTGITLTGSPVIINHTYANNSGYTIDITGRTSAMTGITLSGTNITDISGFSDDRLNISYLNLSNNKIKTLPYVNNKLKHLYLNNNTFFSGNTTGTTTDYDGNIYRYVTIGSQQWMVENLKTTHYADGTVIPNVTGYTSSGLTAVSGWTNNNMVYFSPSDPTLSAYSSPTVVNSCYRIVQAPVNPPTALRIYFTMSRYDGNFPRLFVYDENNTEYLNSLCESTNDFILDVTGSVGKFTMMIYNTNSAKTSPYYTYFNLSSLTVDSITGWPSNKSGAYCWYNNSPSTGTTYGALYNWYATKNIHGLAPTGWKIPTDEDWFTLASYIGGENIAGGLLKETGTTHWSNPNVSATNRYGFTALPGGLLSLSSFQSINLYGLWWTSDRFNLSNGKNTAIFNSNAELYRYNNNANFPCYYGFSVRCMRNITSTITNQYSGTSLETLELSGNSFTTYNSGSLPLSLHSFISDNSALDTTSVTNILNDMYNNTSSKNGMVVSMINTVGLLSGVTQKYNMIDNSGSTVKSVGRFQLLVDRRTTYNYNFTISLVKPVTPIPIKISVDWGDNYKEYILFQSVSTTLSLQHFYAPSSTYVVNVDAHWDYITELSTAGGYYNLCPLDIREFVGLKKLYTYSGSQDNPYGGTLNLSRNNLLEDIDITYNKYTTMIYPNDVSHLRRITTLQCTGVISPHVENMPNLEYLYMQSCSMTGPLYSPIVSKKITYYNVYNNPTLTTGAIPDFTDCTGLTYLDLYNSNRNSNGNTNFTTLSGLTLLRLSNNAGLTGSIPVLDNLNNLRDLYIVSTGYQWVGNTNWDTLTGLTSISMSSNSNLSGSTPSLSASTELQTMSISSNKLYNPLPNFTVFPKLTSITITSNNNTSTPTFGICGPFPDLSNCVNLTTLNLSNNFLNKSSEFNGIILCSTIDSSGRTYVGGQFTIFSGVTQNYLTRLNPNGTRDTSFNIGTGFNGYVNAITVDNSGRSYVGGQFTSFNGTSYKYFVRLNENGSSDTSFATGDTFNNTINCVAIDSSGRTYVGGNFSSFSGVTQQYLMRLNQNGTKDSTYATGNTFNTTVNCVAIDSSGKCYVGGSFSQFNGLAQQYMVRLNENGTKDTSFALGTTSFNSTVNTITLDSSEKILVGGSFSLFSGGTQNYLTKINPDGSKDTSFDGNGFTNAVYSIATDTSGRSYIGGQFLTYSGTTQRCLIRLDSGGTKDTSFDIGSGFTYITNGSVQTPNVRTISIDSSGRTYVGGFFTQYSGNTQKFFVKLNENATKDTTFVCYNPTSLLYLSNCTGLTNVNLQSCNIDYYYDNDNHIGFGLTLLSTLNLYSNNLTSFPNTYNLPSLRTLYLYYNNINSDIPNTFSGNTQLSTFNANTNRITGTFPEYFGLFTSLSNLDFGYNLMSGSLPMCFSGMTALTTITLNNNQFSSGLSYLSNRTTLSSLNLASNSFTTGITYLSGLTTIRSLYLNNNNFSGSTMFSLVPFNALSNINLSNCYLNGELFRSNTITVQSTHDFSFNNFYGDIPPILTTSRSQYNYYYYTRYNYFTGYTSMVGSSHSAYIIDFSYNYLSTTEVNKVIADVVKAVWNGGQLDLRGTYMGLPTGQALLNIDILRNSKSWTVSVNVLNVNTLFNGLVYSVDTDNNGNVFAGGSFSTYNGLAQICLIKFDSGGTKDTSFDIGTGFNNTVWSVVVDSSGKTYVGGGFNTYKSLTQPGMVKLDSGGTIDSSFNIGSGFNTSVRCITVDSSGRTYVGGDFSAFNGISQNYFIRLTSGGTKDTSFDVGTGFGGAVYCSALFDNKIYVGGPFTSYRSVTQYRLTRIDSGGTRDTSFDIGSGFDAIVYALAIDSSNGKIYVGGDFTTFSGSTQNRLIRLNSNGTKDTSFDIGSGFTATVHTISLDNSGGVYVGGDFLSYNGVSVNYFVKLDSGGTIDSSFNIGSGFTGSVQTIKVDSNGKVLVGGDFYSYNKQPYNRLVRLNSGGTVDTSLNLNGTVPSTDPTYNCMDFSYTGTVNTASPVSVSGLTYVVSNSGGSFVWDLGGVGEYKFPSASTITRNINGSNHTIQYASGSSGNFYIKIRKV